MFGSHYEIPDKEKEDEKETRNREEGQVSLWPMQAKIHIQFIKSRQN